VAYSGNPGRGVGSQVKFSGKRNPKERRRGRGGEVLLLGSQEWKIIFL